jgi:hypothetical protein
VSPAPFHFLQLDNGLTVLKSSEREIGQDNIAPEQTRISARSPPSPPTPFATATTRQSHACPTLPSAFQALPGKTRPRLSWSHRVTASPRQRVTSTPRHLDVSTPRHLDTSTPPSPETRPCHWPTLLSQQLGTSLSPGVAGPSETRLIYKSSRQVRNAERLLIFTFVIFLSALTHAIIRNRCSVTARYRF